MLLENRMAIEPSGEDGMREHKLLRLAAAMAAVVAVVAAGCGDSGFEPTRLQVRLSAEPVSILVNGTSTITAQVTNDRGQAASGIPIEWSNSFAALHVLGSGSRSDANGRATATLSGQGDPGVAVITATIVGLTERGQVQVRIGLD